MPNRIIKESINESRSLSELSFFAEDLFKRLITYADDYGRFNADYQIILARLYPREIQIVSELDIEDALIELSGAGKIGFYTSSPKKEIYGCFPNWNNHQRVRDSKNRFPDPDDISINDWYLRRFIPMKLKQVIIERDGFKCRICGKYISTIQNSQRLIKMGAGLYHIDHIVPVNQGGRATEENLQLTCPQCNLRRKRKFSFEEILEMTLREKKIFEDAANCCESKKDAANCCYNPIQSESNSNTMCKADALALFEDLWKLYPSKKGKGQVSLAAKQRLLKVGREEMVRVIGRYMADLEKDKEWRRPQNGSTFFNSGYVDYLDENYESENPQGNHFPELECPEPEPEQNLESAESDDVQPDEEEWVDFSSMSDGEFEKYLKKRGGSDV